MISQLRQFLDDYGVLYQILPHPEVFRSTNIASIMKIPAEKVLKTVMLWADGKEIMTVLPASQVVNFEMLCAAIDVGNISKAKETDFRRLFPNCDVGAMPPFGILYDVRTVADRSVSLADEVVFRGGRHDSVVKMKTEDFLRLADPEICDFGVVEETKKAPGPDLMDAG